MGTLSQAMKFAVDTHFNVVDKGGHSYILHVMRVAFRLRTSDEELMSIAVMHDTVEDGDLSFEVLRVLRGDIE